MITNKNITFHVYFNFFSSRHFSFTLQFLLFWWPQFELSSALCCATVTMQKANSNKLTKGIFGILILFFPLRKKIIIIRFAVYIYNIFNFVLIFFSLLSSCPCSLPLIVLVRILQWCLHSTYCIWWQRVSPWPCEPVGFPQVDWVLLVVVMAMKVPPS